MPRGDIPGMMETQVDRMCGDIGLLNDEIVSSDDSLDGGEVESAPNKDDPVDDLIKNLLDSHAAKTPEADLPVNTQLAMSVLEEDVVFDFPIFPQRLPSTLLEKPHPEVCIQQTAPDRQYGPYWCKAKDVKEVTDATSWVHGHAILVYAEYMVQTCGEKHHTNHIPLEILVMVNKILDA